MKFSIAIPTRNRLEYLKIAIASILAQDYEHWEILISDNDSQQNIQEYIASINDPRIQYFRTEKCVSVTENWNRALNRCSGDYVILIGDDDCFMRGAFSILHQLIRQHALPDLVFSNSLFYFYPGVRPEYPNGHLMTLGNWNLWGSSAPILLNHEKVQEVLRDSFNFKLRFSYNMQTLTIHRSLIEKLKFGAQFFHSPYPDFYAMTVLLRKAEKILFCPYPITTVGICPKSFAAALFTNQEEKGMEALNVATELNQYSELSHQILPGKNFNTCWLYAMQTALNKLGESEIQINFRRYRKIQIVEFLSAWAQESRRSSELLKFCLQLQLPEMVASGPKIGLIWLIAIVLGKNKISEKFIDRMRIKLNPHPGHTSHQFPKEYHSISEVIENIDPYECHTLFKL